MPDNVAVPLPLSVKVTPPGRVPVSLRAGVGNPLAVTVNTPALPTWKLVAAALVMAGVWATVSVKFCWALGSVPLLALIVIG